MNRKQPKIQKDGRETAGKSSDGSFPGYDGEVFLESETGRPDSRKCRFHILPFPFEASVSYGGGTRRGPEAIIEASQQLELYDGISFPGEAGIFTHPSVRVPEQEHPGDGDVQHCFEDAGNRVEQILQSSAIPVTLGGEHSISYAPLQALKRHYSPRNIGIVQIDAHADLRLAYEGRVWSHASVMRRLADQGFPILQLGVRALCREERDYRDSAENIVYYDARELIEQDIRNIRLPEEFPELLYLSIDLDGLDPSIMPATGTPVPGGLGWYQTLDLLASIIAQRHVAGLDMVELAPMDQGHAWNYTAAQLLYSVLGLIQRLNPGKSEGL
ncbi:agmatinase [Salinispira pacifica]|uniref:Agmatinase n=1 Tax=Salinispira pacifica TaxID=1307761 RepID=V5WJI8_9SPIO|nr:agmatinase [Salinispira pacifica]AHC15724.1 Agmatinase [Salinispira pacifica]